MPVATNADPTSHPARAHFHRTRPTGIPVVHRATPEIERSTADHMPHNYTNNQRKRKRKAESATVLTSSSYWRQLGEKAREKKWSWADEGSKEAEADTKETRKTKTKMLRKRPTKGSPLGLHNKTCQMNHLTTKSVWFVWYRTCRVDPAKSGCNVRSANNGPTSVAPRESCLCVSQLHD